MREIPYPTPGEILLEEFLNSRWGLPNTAWPRRSACRSGVLAKSLREKRAITVDTGLRLSRFFGMNDGFWTGLQTDLRHGAHQRCTGRCPVAYSAF
jgi:addiction module HigA family antidote